MLLKNSSRYTRTKEYMLPQPAPRPQARMVLVTRPAGAKKQEEPVKAS